ncbi:MAG TPA: SusC/RagA family TonB-linked outer membrane protein [Gemmatimonadaceae bacterium]|jgi:TonB-linked SusC/RagA family outer membrane protein|nr:SusC/RagA family TonB-linked outer membrane protein [Gemmatimonadaceae bacterium]
MRRFALAIGWSLAGLAAAVGPVRLASQESGGTVTGRVTDKGTGGGVGQAVVTVVGTAIRVQTSDSGTYRLRRVPAGTQTLRAIRLGYTANTVTVSVTDGATVTGDMSLTPAARVLTQVQITGTGQSKESREVATFTPTLAVDSMTLAATPNFASVLEGSAPGVQVTQASGTTGAGARVRIRGASSISLSNEPLLVIDGVEVDNNPNALSGNGNPLGIAVGGQQPSRLNDINPEDIESVQTLQGPAATGLYGTAAANGVIVITTKRGTAGKQHWDGFVENGELHDQNDYPANYGAFSNIGYSNCQIFFTPLPASQGGCTIDSVTHYSPLRGQLTPIRMGRRQEYNLSTSGGSDVNQYFVSGDYQLENGTDIGNQLQKTNARANFSTRPRSDLSISMSAGYVASNTRLPQNDNDILGNLSEGLLGNGLSGPANNFGYFGGNLNPAVMSAIRTFEDIQRFTPSVTASYTPVSWLSANLTGGFDLVNSDQEDGEQPNIVPFGNDILGTRTRDRLEDETYTLNANVNGTANLPMDIRSTTTVGGSWRRTLETGTFAQGAGLTAGSSSLTAVSQLIAVSEINQDNRVLGGFVQQQFGWRDKLFITAGIRLDKNSSTGIAAGTAAYPTANASYVISDEPWFPKSNIISALKLRFAAGQSGLHPDFLNALTYKNPVTGVTPAGNPTSAFTAGNPGNPDLKPERTTEIEEGFDLSVLKDRLTVGLTYYDKHTTDALIQQTLAPSVGDTTFQWANLGRVRNRGLELQTTAEVVRMRNANFTVTGNFSTLENRLQHIGTVNNTPIITGLGGATQEFAQGKPLGGFWQLPYTYTTTNGIVTPNDVTVGPNRVYLGSVLPTENASLSPELTLFRIVKISSLFDFQGGNKLYNGTDDFRCGQFFNCQEDYTKGNPALQARDIADRFYGTVAGFIQDASFWKWREAAVSLLLPPEYARKIYARGATVTLAVRNLRTWTKYGGLDPEVLENLAGANNFEGADFLTQPPVRYYTVRVTLNY